MTRYDSIHLVELEDGLYLGVKSSSTENIGMAKRYESLHRAKQALSYIKRHGNWPHAKTIDAVTALRRQ